MTPLFFNNAGPSVPELNYMIDPLTRILNPSGGTKIFDHHRVNLQTFPQMMPGTLLMKQDIEWFRKIQTRNSGRNLFE